MRLITCRNGYTRKGGNYMKGFKTWFALCVPILVFMCGTASALGFEASIGYWKQSPSGDISYKALSVQDNLSIKNNLKYGSETKVMGRLKIEAPFIPNIYLMASPMEFSGHGSKNATFQFGDISFNGNVPFKSDVKLDQYDIGLYYGVPGLKLATLGVLNIDLGLDAKIINLKAQLTGQDTFSGMTVTQSKSLTPPVPMLYLGIQVKPVKWLSAEGEFRGGAYSGNRYYDYILRAKVKPIGPAFAAAGYRYEKVKVDMNDVKGDINFGGPFGEVGVEF
jgi:outer membrane protein